MHREFAWSGQGISYRVVSSFINLPNMIEVSWLRVVEPAFHLYVVFLVLFPTELTLHILRWVLAFQFSAAFITSKSIMAVLSSVLKIRPNGTGPESQGWGILWLSVVTVSSKAQTRFHLCHHHPLGLWTLVHTRLYQFQALHVDMAISGKRRRKHFFPLQYLIVRGISFPEAFNILLIGSPGPRWGS